MRRSPPTVSFARRPVTYTTSAATMTPDPMDETLRAETSASPGPVAVVGLGASAGGIDALRTFFANAPSGSGIAYVVILHLSPDYESRLAEVLQVASRMTVTQVRSSTKLAGDQVYVISPNQMLEVREGTLHVTMMSGG